MGVYNTLRTTFKCPHCGCTDEIDIDLYFGFRNLVTYKIGDRYHWAKFDSIKKGGRPPHGDTAGEGYAVCGFCKKDFFVLVEVANDVIASVEYDATKKPHIDDNMQP